MNCSHCDLPMPRDPDGFEIPVGWTVVRLEQHHKLELTITYLYLCSRCMISTSSRQTSLLETP
jgi:hypothetical protein